MLNKNISGFQMLPSLIKKCLKTISTLRSSLSLQVTATNSYDLKGYWWQLGLCFRGFWGFFYVWLVVFCFDFLLGFFWDSGGGVGDFLFGFFLLLFALAKFLESTPVSSEDWLRTCKSSVVKGERKGCSWSAVPYASSPPSRSKIAQTSLCLIVTSPD